MGGRKVGKEKEKQSIENHQQMIKIYAFQVAFQKPKDQVPNIKEHVMKSAKKAEG